MALKMGKRSKMIASVAAAGVAVSAFAIASAAQAAPSRKGPFGAQADAMRTVSGAGVTANVLGNDVAPAGVVASLMAITQPANGAVFCVGGSCTYTPRPRFIGSDSFTYTSTDGAGATSVATVTVKVNDAYSDSPLSVVRSVDAPANVTTAVNVFRNPTDRDGNPFQILSVRRTGGGRVELSRDGRVLYTPAAGFTGVDTISVMLSDGHGGVRSTSVAVIVS